ncbi:MAG: F0F1 ATP synthase subunit A [Lactobacillales bacterium]|nr:F0F1 ATP synthase subunit A [Lactobacillales bacterium]
MEAKDIIFSIPFIDQLLGHKLYFDGTVLIMTALAVLIVFLIAFICTRNMKLKPTGKQNFIEWVIDFSRGIAKNNLPKQNVEEFHLICFSLFMFLIISNLLGLVTKIVIHKTNYWKSPTSDAFVTLGLAAVMIIATHYFGVKKLGVKGYFKTYFSPMPILFPFKVIEEFTNLLTLGLRLYGNIYAGEILLGLICTLVMSTNWIVGFVAIPLEMVWIAFSIFIGAIQAFIFTTLSMVYMSHKISVEH